MDVVLGVAVTGPVARLALLGPGAGGGDVIDQSVVDLADHPIETLTETVVGTNRLLAGENHRLVGTRLCWTDPLQAQRLREALEGSGVANVAALSESQAVAALMRAAGQPGAALVMDDTTGTLSVLGSAAGDPDAPPTVLAKKPLTDASGADATGAFSTMMAKLSAQPNGPQDVYLLGASPDLNRVADQLRDVPTMRVQVADDPTFALARGAAIAGAATAMAPALGDATAMAPAVGDATAMAPAVGRTGDATTVVPAAELVNAEEPQLAYSMADDDAFADEMEDYGPEFDEYGDYDEFGEAGPARLSRRSLVIGNAVIAFAVIGLASLAAAIAIAVRPTASQQPVIGVQNAAPGKFMPILPSQQQAPIPAPPVDQPNAGFQGGIVPAPGETTIPEQLLPGGGGTPRGPVPVAPGIPGGPGAPGWGPNPNPLVPVPVPVPIPFPGWRPNYPPYYPPPTTYYPPTTTYYPPTTTYSPPTTTTYSPPTTTTTTTTSAPPTTTHTTAPTTTSAPPTTTTNPPTTTTNPPTTTTHAPPTTTNSPPTTAPSTKPTTQVPTQTQTVPPTHSPQQPLTPQQPQPRPHRGF